MHLNLYKGKNETKFDVIKSLKVSRYGTKRIDTRIDQVRITIHRRIDISFQPYLQLNVVSQNTKEYTYFVQIFM